MPADFWPIQLLVRNATEPPGKLSAGWPPQGMDRTNYWCAGQLPHGQLGFDRKKQQGLQQRLWWYLPAPAPNRGGFHQIQALNPRGQRRLRG